MNYLRNYKNRYATKIELVSALEDDSFLISPPNGFSSETVVTNYNGIYFTLNSASLSEKSKSSKAGVAYVINLDFNFPEFVGLDQFKEKFKQLSEVKITYNTNEWIRLNCNDISLNRPIDVEFSTSKNTVSMSLQFTSLFPLRLYA